MGGAERLRGTGNRVFDSRGVCGLGGGGGASPGGRYHRRAACPVGAALRPRPRCPRRRRAPVLCRLAARAGLARCRSLRTRRQGVGAPRRLRVAALFYMGFAAVALSTMLGWDQSASSDQIARDWTAWMLAKPFGQWIVAAVGAAITAIGLGIGIAGLWGELRRRLDLKAEERRLIVALGRFSFVARSPVFAMIGLFLLYAAPDSNSRAANGFAGAWRLIQHLPHGSLLLGICAGAPPALGV